MSGIAGILNLDGSPVDVRLLARMSEYLRFRGPDGQGMHAIGHLGFVHTSLNVIDDTEADAQPLTVDGRRWIVADARIDARVDLVKALRAQGQPIGDRASDAELILRAYNVWGEECVLRLLGDFTFAIWDSDERRLFCARDHLGVKPFFYAHAGHVVVFSNTLDCVRLHPAVSGALNDDAIADFLLFGGNEDFETTSFRDIRRLPPAHAVAWSPGAVKERRYWTLPIDEPLFFKRPADYTERFVELLRAAVNDRLRARRASVLMSGGVDSTSIAAVAVSLMRERSSDSTPLHAITSVYERLIPDGERHYAGLVADHLKIPIHYDVRDDEPSLSDWNNVRVHTPEPTDNPPAFKAGVEFRQTMAVHARVLLYGEGPDNALRYEWLPYLTHLLAGRRVVPLLRAISSDILMHPRVPLWSLIRELTGARALERQWRQEFPNWLDEEFSVRHKCRARWEERLRPATSAHPVRPIGHGGFNSMRWQQLFEECDIQDALAHTQMRHPFLDLRLLRYMLALPAMPWCRNKLIIRRAMHTWLPVKVLRRKKTTVPVSADFVRATATGLPRLTSTPRLSSYVNAGKVPSAVTTVVELRAALRPLGLNHWLTHLAGNS